MNDKNPLPAPISACKVVEVMLSMGPKPRDVKGEESFFDKDASTFNRAFAACQLGLVKHPFHNHRYIRAEQYKKLIEVEGKEK